ncbi:hypothetical protein HAPAU_20230 [Halalkalicoccus paucihalophilus]|jgi:hypothetical protein|uniref:Uncharacterized protein n=1 Tax=Halalkalicoccus paucihalophilus TaxID=1008153 RepID=A0A151ACL8_9EURY|nr:hypothetical protein HAPAU_20230 [Halalkalicoccus paucihalophilus]
MGPWTAAIATIIGAHPIPPSLGATTWAPLQTDPGIWPTIAQVSVGANVLLLAVLGGIWARNYWQFRSKHTLGLLVFSVLLLAENALALYYYMVDPTLATWFATAVPAIAWRAMMLLHVLETVALLFLVWITWD